MSILEDELAELISDSLQAADLPYAVQVTVMVPGVGAGWDSGPSTPQNHDCQGWRDVWTYRELLNTNILASDVKVMILAPTLDIDPNTAATITVKGQTLAIVKGALDAAGALWVVQARS